MNACCFNSYLMVRELSAFAVETMLRNVFATTFLIKSNVRTRACMCVNFSMMNWDFIFISVFWKQWRSRNNKGKNAENV